MCVIIIKEKGVKLPSKKFLQSTFNANSHGAGYATDKGKFFKTLSFDVFYQHFRNNVKKEDACIIHFRLATHGSINPNNCHPFKGKVEGIGDVFFAHNGILDIHSQDNKTDSELCFRNILIPVMTMFGYGKSLDIAIEGVIGSSKFCMVDGSGVVHRWGDWTNHNGLWLSNTRFLGWSHMFGNYGKSSYSRAYAYDEDEYDDFRGWLDSKK